MQNFKKVFPKLFATHQKLVYGPLVTQPTVWETLLWMPLLFRVVLISSVNTAQFLSWSLLLAARTRILRARIHVKVLF